MKIKANPLLPLKKTKSKMSLHSNKGENEGDSSKVRVNRKLTNEESVPESSEEEMEGTDMKDENDDLFASSQEEEAAVETNDNGDPAHVKVVNSVENPLMDVEKGEEDGDTDWARENPGASVSDLTMVESEQKTAQATACHEISSIAARKGSRTTAAKEAGYYQNMNNVGKGGQNENKDTKDVEKDKEATKATSKNGDKEKDAPKAKSTAKPTALKKTQDELKRTQNELDKITQENQENVGAVNTLQNQLDIQQKKSNALVTLNAGLKNKIGKLSTEANSNKVNSIGKVNDIKALEKKAQEDQNTIRMQQDEIAILKQALRKKDREVEDLAADNAEMQVYRWLKPRTCRRRTKGRKTK